MDVNEFTLGMTTMNANKIKWTISKKVTGTVSILLSVILALLIHSVFSLQEIERELTEVATIDVPLTQYANEIEIAQLEQRILLDEIIRKQLNNKESISAEVEQIKQWSSKISQHFSLAIAVAKQGKKLTLSNDFIAISKALTTLEKQHQTLEQLLNQLVAKQDQKALLAQLIEQDEHFDHLAIELIHTIEKLTARKAKLVLKHETQFATISYSLSAIGVLIGVVLATLIITSIKRGMNKLSSNIDLVSQAIKTKQDIPVEQIEQLGTDDEFDQLSQNFSKMVQQVSSDIGEREQQSKTLETLASRDHLTGCFNRMKWDECRHQKISQSLTTNAPLCLIFLDIDHFKAINDNYGHDAGDSTLVSVVKLVQENIRESDSLFRTGGEEFSVLLPNTALEEAQQLAERIRANVAEHNFKVVNNVTISLGVTVFKGESDNESDFSKRADQALYHAKENGRNQVSTL